MKVNDGNFEQIVDIENSDLDLVANSIQTNNWKDENGNVSFRLIPNSAIEKKEYFSILISNCVAVEKNKR